MAAPVMAAAPSPPTVDGVVSGGEWDGATVIPTADGVSTVSVLADTDYMYVLFQVADSTDARVPGENIYGNDQTSININPTPGDTNWGMPCDIILQTGADPAAWGGTSSGETDGWETDWEIAGTQLLALPADLETKTIYSGGTRISEWKVPLATINPASGDILDVAGTANIGDGNSYCYPPELNDNVPANWGDLSIFVDILVRGGTSVGAVIVIPEDLIQISVSPLTLDFGSVYRGQSSAAIGMEITNTGSVPVLVSTSTGSAFYQAALTIDGVSVVTWNDTIAFPGSISPDAQVTVPSDWPAGMESGTIIFWAEEAQ